MRGVNLIPASHRWTRMRQQRRRAWYVGTLLYAGALMLAWAGAHLWWPDRQEVAAAQLSAVRRDVRDREAAIAEIRPQLQEALTTLAAARSVGNQPDWSLLLTLLAELLGDDTVLSTCTLTVARPDVAPAATAAPSQPLQHIVTLTGLGRSQSAVLAYVRKLEDTGLFHAVNLIDTHQESFAAGQAIAFRIECTIRLTKGKGR